MAEKPLESRALEFFQSAAQSKEKKKVSETQTARTVVPEMPEPSGVSLEDLMQAGTLADYAKARAIQSVEKPDNGLPWYADLALRTLPAAAGYFTGTALGSPEIGAQAAAAGLEESSKQIAEMMKRRQDQYRESVKLAQTRGSEIEKLMLAGALKKAEARTRGQQQAALKGTTVVKDTAREESGGTAAAKAAQTPVVQYQNWVLRPSKVIQRGAPYSPKELDRIAVRQEGLVQLNRAIENYKNELKLGRDAYPSGKNRFQNQAMLNLMLALKNMQGFGALQQAEIDFLNDIVPSPSIWKKPLSELDAFFTTKGDATKAQRQSLPIELLNGLQNLYFNETNAILENAGYGYKQEQLTKEELLKMPSAFRNEYLDRREKWKRIEQEENNFLGRQGK